MRQRRIPRRYLSLTFISLFLLGTIIVVKSRMSENLSLFGRASYQPANIYVDTKPVIGTTVPAWRSLAQGGESSNYQFSSIQSQLASLNPEYIRLDHIYDFYEVVSKNPQGNLIFNWQKLDSIISQIRAVGATPFLSLSYMPEALNPGDVTGKPTNFSEWQAVVKATIEHVSGRGALNLTNVYYEVWNEPDLFGNWKTYGDKNYLTLYEFASRGATSAYNTNPFFLGGPATTALYDNWTTEFFKYAADKNLRVDFYSWHSYESDVAQFPKDVIRYYESVRKYPQYLNVEPIITEWGHESDNDAGFDTNLSAAHAVSVISELIPTIKHTFIFEIQDGKDPEGKEYWGRWGLLTHQDFGSHEKPRFQALKLLNKLGADRLSIIGQGDFIKGLAAKKLDGTTQVILANYDLENLHTETVPVNFLNLEPGSYRLTTEFLGRLPTSTIVTASAPTLIHNVSMPPNSVVLLELIKQ